jgi:hypothetical protein
MLQRRKRVSWERKLVPSAWNILMLSARRHVQIRTLRKIPPWVKVSDRKGKNVARLAPKEFSKGSSTTIWSWH